MGVHVEAAQESGDPGLGSGDDLMTPTLSEPLNRSGGEARQARCGPLYFLLRCWLSQKVTLKGALKVKTGTWRLWMPKQFYFDRVSRRSTWA